MEWLLREFEKFKVQYNCHPDKHFKPNINFACKKLDEYYTLLKISPIYLAALILHPRYKIHWIKKHWAGKQTWIEEGVTAVEELWKAEYKDVPIPETESGETREGEEPDRLQEFWDRDLSSDNEDDSMTQLDELSNWQSLRPDKKAINPIEYWKNNQHTWPHLARFAFDTLGIPAMSSEAERTFSDAGEVITKRRNRLHANTVNACLCLKQWDNAGAIEWK